MDLYILDSLYRHKWVYDEFESLIWTERWNHYGDFELSIKSTHENRTRFTTGTKLAINKSERVMIVEMVEDSTADDGEEMLSISGRSLETILENRIAKDSMATSADSIWYLDTSPIGAAREMYIEIVENGRLDANDDLPNVTQRFPTIEDTTIYTIEVVITWAQKLDTLYNAIRDVCTKYDLGFRMIRDPNTSQLYFEVHYSNDRTTRQTFFTPVIFGTSLENIQNTKELSSIYDMKNVAYVFSSEGNAIVYADDVDPTVTGFERRVLIVHANVPAGSSGIVEQQGKEALAKHRAQWMFDGELDQAAEYVYGVDYGLGDLVEMRNRDGVISYKRVTEQIFVDDANGERAYPTLSMGMFESPNTWSSYEDEDTTWSDFTTEEWADL